MEIIGMIVIGFIAGSIAKYLTPQAEKAGFFLTTMIGIGGAVVGGFVGRLLGLGPTGWIGAIIWATIGAVVILVVYHKVKK